VKTVAVTPDAAGRVVETVTRKRILDASEASSSDKQQRTTPDFWDYVEKLTPQEWERHIVYLYRRESEVGPSPQLEKCTGVIEVPGLGRVLFDDRDEVQHAIGQKYGGGTYRLILKRGHERICEGRIVAEGVRKNPPAPAAAEYGNGYGGPTVTSSDATADVAHHAIATLSGQDRLAMDVGISALRNAADVVDRFSRPRDPVPPAAPSETDALLKQALAAMLTKMMNPPDPLEQIAKLLTVMAQLRPPGDAAGSPVVGKVIDAAIEKLLNPAPAGPAAENAGAELVRQLPGVAGYVAQAIHEWRVGIEAQRDTVALSRGVPLPPARAAGAPASQPTQTLGAPVPPGGEVMQPHPPGEPSLEFIEGKILEMFREPVSADEAADRAVQFIDTLSPQLVDQLKTLGEAGLLHLFQTRPVLRPALQNLPRLQEFIRAFLKFAHDGEPPAAKPV
jgi:hypothetical protein